MNITIAAPNAKLSNEEKNFTIRTASYALGQVSQSVREVRITVFDDNGPKGGIDKRCMVRIRLAPRGMLVISKKALHIREAISKALDTAKNVVSKKLVQRTRRARGANKVLLSFEKD